MSPDENYLFEQFHQFIKMSAKAEQETIVLLIFVTENVSFCSDRGILYEIQKIISLPHLFWSM